MRPKLVIGDRVFRIDSIPGSSLPFITSKLSYRRKESHFDPIQGKFIVNTANVPLYRQENGSLIVPIGYINRVQEALNQLGLSYDIEDKRSRKPDDLAIDTSVLQDKDLRPVQKKILECMVEYPRGMFQCPTGSGKSYVLTKVCRLFPDAKIHIVTKRVDVAKTIHRYISAAADGGIVCSKLKIENARVMVYTIGSVHHGNFDADILIADEAHELATRKSVGLLARYVPKRAYALSATIQHRFDSAHEELEGIFGPVLVDERYSSSVEHGSVVPIVVVWIPVEEGPSKAMYSRMYKRYAIWKNDARNDIIAEVAKKLWEGGKNQTMISVEVVEHAYELKKRLPEFQVVFGNLSPRTESRILSEKLATKEELHQIMASRDSIRRSFEIGQIRGVIATDVWSTGVSFNDLSVLIRAEGGVSGIKSVQVPGRVARIAPGKECGVVVDFEDRFDMSLMNQAKQRRRIYESNGWEQIKL